MPKISTGNLIVEQISSMSQFADYFELKCDKTAILWSGFDSAPNVDVMRNYFYTLINSNKIAFLFRYCNVVVGYCQISRQEDYIEIDGYSVLSNYSGLGFGKEIIGLFSSPENLHSIVKDQKSRGGVMAWVSENNIASLKCFLNNDFEIVLGKEKFVELKALKRTDRFVLLRKIW